MKKLFYLIALLFLPIIVNASSTPSVSTYKDIVINGDITKEFIDNYKNRSTDVTFTLSSNNGDTFDVTVKYVSHITDDNGQEQSIVDEIYMHYYVENNILISTYDYDEPANYNKLTDEEKAHIEHAKELYKLIPIWGLESSADYKKMKGFREAGDDYINFLSPIFEKCYMAEKGACYTESTHIKVITLKGEIELSTKPVDYALKYLENQGRDRSQHKTYIYCIIIIAILGPIFLIKLKEQDREDLQRKHDKLYGNKFFK